MNGKFMVGKTFDHNLGLSCVFRQWRDTSHCSFLHGYAIAVTLRFSASKLDERGWVISFGGFSQIKEYLAATFDHKTLVATDDPHLGLLNKLHEQKIIDMVVVDNVGCEAFAYMVGQYVIAFLNGNADYRERNVRLVSCTIKEHSANEVTWIAP